MGDEVAIDLDRGSSKAALPNSGKEGDCNALYAAWDGGCFALFTRSGERAKSGIVGVAGILKSGDSVADMIATKRTVCADGRYDMPNVLAISLLASFWG